MKGFKYIVRVEGACPFPIDMLRYDRCSPHKEKDSCAIARSIAHGANFDPEPVEVVRFSKSGKWEPTRARWESRLWKIASVVREQIETDLL